MNRIVAMALILGTGLLCQAQNLVENGDFAAGAAEPAQEIGWHIPPGSPWQVTNADGVADPFSLRHVSRGPLPTAPPATQTIRLATHTEYVLTAALKSTGRLRPLVRLTAAEKELARVAYPPDAAAATWHSLVAHFNSATTPSVTVELWADAAAVTDGRLPGGSAGIDRVQIMTARDFEALHPEQNPHAEGDNLAYGRPYALVPQPSYPLCADPGDKEQLTDGVRTNGYFWTQKSTVGWSRTPKVTITIDLGEDLPIRAVSFNTAAGVAGVEWPRTITVLLSVDGLNFHEVGDLVTMTQDTDPPPAGRYTVHCFRSTDLQTHGRYVKFVVEPSGNFCFVDEIQVLRGEPGWLQRPLPGPAMLYPREYMDDDLFNAAIKRRVGYDLVDLQRALLDATLPAGTGAALRNEIVSLEAAIGSLPVQEPEGYRSVIPLNDLHAQVYAVYGKMRAAAGSAPLRAWGANPWDFLQPADLPAAPPPARLAIGAMRGEPRAGAINLTNATAAPLRVTLAFAGEHAREMESDLSIHQVEWTDTAEGIIVGTALLPLETGPDGPEVRIPAGMTRQLWFTFRPAALAAGSHMGNLLLNSAGAAPVQLPVMLRVFDLDFPARPTLHVGGWDYTDAETMYGITRKNREALIAHLRERYVDSPWATSAVMGFATPGSAPDTTRFDRWLARWPDARRYCVFNNVRDRIGDVALDDPAFETRVAEWIRFWVAHARTKGIEPGQLVLLLVDEPHRREQDERILAWARPIRAAEPEVVIWEDPTYRDPTEALPEMMAIATQLCPNRPMLLAQGKPFADFYRMQKAAGRRLDFYSCSGPAFLLDPYAYYRLQAWTCVDFGAESTFFWAFGDTGNSNPWNAYKSARTAYAPMFLAPDSVTPAKQMEAIRESVQDVEYLVMLQQAITVLAGNRPGDARLARARALLENAPRRVLDQQTHDGLKWQVPKDRTVADSVRLEVGGMLEHLTH